MRTCRKLPQRRAGPGRCRPGRRRDQAAYRAIWRRKVGGFRTIILFQARTRAFFVHGFAKNERDNIDDKELAAFKMLAAQLLAYDEAALAKTIAAGVLMEVKFDDQTIS